MSPTQGITYHIWFCSNFILQLKYYNLSYYCFKHIYIHYIGLRDIRAPLPHAPLLRLCGRSLNWPPCGVRRSRSRSDWLLLNSLLEKEKLCGEDALRKLRKLWRARYWLRVCDLCCGTQLNCLTEYEEHQTDGSVSIKVLVRRRVCVGVCVAAVCTARVLMSERSRANVDIERSCLKLLESVVCRLGCCLDG